MDMDFGSLTSSWEILPELETPMENFLTATEPNSFGFLLIHLVAAFGISESQVSAYCSIKVGAQRAKSRVADKQLHPVWDEVLNFVVSNADTMLSIVVLNKDILSAVELCSTRANISQIFHPSRHWRNTPLTLRLSDKHSSAPTGSLELTLRFIPTKTDMSPPATDRYGFIFEGFDWKVSLEEQQKAIASESVDWQCVDRPPTDPAKVLTKGIGHAYKAEAWELYARTILDLPENLFDKDCYKMLLKQQPHPIHMEHIELDIPRTFPGHLAFKSQQGRDALASVLKAMTLWNPSVGYCQSMNNVVALLLLVADEERAFRLAVILIYYIIGDYHSNNMMGLQVDQFVLTNLIAQHMPQLADHFKALNVNIVLFITGWFMNIFACSFPFPTVLRVWDLIFCECSSSAMVRISLAVLKTLENSFLELEDLVKIPEVLSKPNSLCYNWDEIIENLEHLPTTKEVSKLRKKATYIIVERHQEHEFPKRKGDSDKNK